MKNLPPGWNAVRVGLGIVSVSTIALCFILLGMAAAVLALIPLMVAAFFGPQAGTFTGLIFLILVVGCGVRLIMADVLSTSIAYICAAYLLLLVVLTIYLPALLAVLLFGVMALAGLGLLTGWCFCFAVPNEGGLRLFIVGSAAALLAGIICHSINVITVGMSGANPANLQRLTTFATLSIAALVLSLLGHLLYVLFLRSVGSYFRDRPTIEYIDRYLFYQVAATLVGLGLQAALVFGITDGSGAGALCLLFFAMMVLALIGAIWFLRCVEAARSLIRPYMRE